MSRGVALKPWKWILLLSVLGFALVIIAGRVGVNNSHRPIRKPDVAVADKKEVKEEPAAKRQSLSAALGMTEDEIVEIGGVKRPARDLLMVDPESIDSDADREAYLQSLPNAGKTKGVARKTNAQVDRLYAELSGEEDVPAARSMLFSEGPFDKEKYLENPESYLAKIRPARAIHAHKPEPGITRLKSDGSLYREIVQGESAILRVKADPGMPVTFHAQLGEFENRLKTISVASSEEGVAEVVYRAVSGVSGNIQLSAASPVHSGRLNYLVNVRVNN